MKSIQSKTRVVLLHHLIDTKQRLWHGDLRLHALRFAHLPVPPSPSAGARGSVPLDSHSPPASRSVSQELLRMCSLIPIGGSHVSTSHSLGCQHTPHHSSRCCTYSLVTSLGPPSSSSALGEGGLRSTSVRRVRVRLRRSPKPKSATLWFGASYCVSLNISLPSCLNGSAVPLKRSVCMGIKWDTHMKHLAWWRSHGINFQSILAEEKNHCLQLLVSPELL